MPMMPPPIPATVEEWIDQPEPPSFWSPRLRCWPSGLMVVGEIENTDHRYIARSPELAREDITLSRGTRTRRLRAADSIKIG